MGDAPRFRFASVDDIPAIVDLVQRTYRGDASRAGWTTEADLLDGQRTDADEVATLVAASRSRVIVAELDDEIVGCCHVEDRGDGVAYLGLFSVTPERQGGGLGRAIVREAERVAADEWGATAMQMTVIRQREDLLAWYERLGYARTGATAPFPYGDERFGIPRRDDLEFVVIERPIGWPFGPREVRTRTDDRFTVSPTLPSDRAELLAAFRAIVAANEGYPQHPDDPVTDEAFDGYWLTPARLTVVARRADGAFAGAYTMKPNNLGRASHVANAGYFVVPTARGKGLGEALVLDSMEAARALGFDALQFNFVFESNPARRLYERLGFEAVGRVPGVIDGEAVIIYWRAL